MRPSLFITSLIAVGLTLSILNSGGCSGSGTSPSSTDPTSTTTTTVPASAGPLRFLFIHHSVGEGFLEDGGMWNMLEGLGLEVHDRTYGDGWVGENTDPEHFPITFTQHYQDMITWELPSGEHYDIVAFKSCFPASNICSDAMLSDYQGYYDTIRSVVRQHPDILFIPFTTPPLVPNETEPHCAARARQFANWLTGAYDDSDPNLAVYNVFDVLAGNDPTRADFNCLSSQYQSDPWDSHPNSLANSTVANHFTQWLSALGWF